MRYAYIDGKSLEQEIESFAKILGVQTIPFDHGMFINNLSADRAFYYDALPSKKVSESEEEFDERRAKKEQFFSALNRIPRMHVRTGTSKWARGNNLKQKGVDVLLAVDAVTHAYDGTTEGATFVLSDLDFYPVLETLLQTQVRTTLVYRPRATDISLVECADHALSLSQTLLLKSCEPNFAAPFFPKGDQSSYPLSEEERKKARVYHLWGNEYAIWQHDDGQWVVFAVGSRFRGITPELVSEHCLGENAFELFK